MRLFYLVTLPIVWAIATLVSYFHPGDEYGSLEVIREVEPGAHSKRRFLCRCSCGSETETRLDHLRSGHSNSCGRCGLELRGERKTLREWAREYNIKESTLRARLKVMGLAEALGRR